MTTIKPTAAPFHDGELIPLAEQFDNHDEFCPEATAALVGRSLSLDFGDGVVVDLTFDDASTLSWRSSRPLLWGEASEADRYEAVVLREGVHAITLARLDRNTSALAILDEPARRVLVNLTTFLQHDGGMREVTSTFQAGIGRPLADPFERTEELIGKRVAHRYSTSHVFEHIYLNPNTYAFQGLAGPEAGVTEIDPADYWKLGPELYLLSWHERSQPFNGAVVVDLAERRATGRLVGWDAIGSRTLQVRTGSRITVLSETRYEGV